MKAPTPGEPQALPRLACTPAAIRAVLAANADADTLRRYDADLNAAFERARSGDLTPLLATVRRWWFEADSWRDPAARREYLGRLNHYLAAGQPPANAAGQPPAHPRTVPLLTPSSAGIWTSPLRPPLWR
jgi:Family of unknown function (DUF6247)